VSEVISVTLNREIVSVRIAEEPPVVAVPLDIAIGVPGSTGIQGDPGSNGWSPEFGVITDADRRVLQLIGWVGGTGIAPTDNIGDYVGVAGFTSVIADAIDIRGPEGGVGGGGSGDMLAATYDPTNVADDVFDMENMVEGATKKILTVAERTKVGHLSVTQAVDLDALETASHTHANSAVLAATTASFLTADETKLDFIAVTQAVDLDALETASHTHANSAVLAATTASFLTADETKLDGIEALADVTDAGNVGSSIHGATAKTTPVDADTMPLIDSAASNVLKKVTWANIKATLKTYFDTLYELAGAIATHAALTATHGATGAVVGTTNSQTLTNKTIALGSNTVSGTIAEFNTAITDADIQPSDPFLDDIAALTDPGADRLLFWDDSVGDIGWLSAGSGLSISGTTLSATGGASGAILSQTFQPFTANGTYTPTTGMVFCQVRAVGGGGGGGGSTGATSTARGAGGGQGGGYAEAWLTAADIGASKAVTIGTAGSGGTGANAGTAGGDTSLGSLVVAKGGAGGGFNNGSSSWGPGGFATTAGTGNFSRPGFKGHRGITVEAAAGHGMGGDGGGSEFGVGGDGGSATSATSSANGGAGVGSGAGGGGGACRGNGSNSTGGAGTVGYMIIREFLSV
jgi:hypothetical protein